MSSSKKGEKPAGRKPVERIIPIILTDDTAVVSSQTKEGTTVTSSVSPLQSIESLNKSSTSTTDESELPSSSEAEKTPEKMELEIPGRTLPPYNVPEKIIIVLDRACDEVFSYFELNNGTRYRPLQMLKNSLLFFVHNKHFIDPKHEFALIVLNECSASWAMDFTTDVQRVVDMISKVEECETEDILNLNSVFELIIDNVTLPVVTDELLIPPPYVVRTIFMYGRSITMPQIDCTNAVKALLDSPYFTFDVVMTHETPDSSNKCNLIFKKLQELDTKGYAYFYPVARNSSELHLVMGKLTGHPLQRPLQKSSKKR